MELPAVIALCPHCENAGTMVVTTATVLRPVYANRDLAGAHVYLSNNAMSMLSCRLCGWRVEGQLEGAAVVGSILATGRFVATEAPVVPPAPERTELAPP
jgi:hypothetical protein